MTVWLRQRRHAVLVLLASLALVAFIACAGDAGVPGSPGQPGSAGEPGAAGNPGSSGDPGNPGPTGPSGPSGAQGTAGVKGQLGPTGPQGSTGGVGADASLGALVIHDSGGTTAGSVRLGNSVDVLGGGFAGGEVITLQLAHSGGTDTIDAGSVVANDNGAFAALSVRLPAGRLSVGDVAAVWATGDAGTVAVAALLVSPEGLTLRMRAQNAPSQFGSATLIADGSKTIVIVNVTPGAAGQPMHIHSGTCDNLGGVSYGLTQLTNGRSESSVSVSLQALLDGDFAINVHESGSNAGNYTSCGGI